MKNNKIIKWLSVCMAFTLLLLTIVPVHAEEITPEDNTFDFTLHFDSAPRYLPGDTIDFRFVIGNNSNSEITNIKVYSDFFGFHSENYDQVPKSLMGKSISLIDKTEVDKLSYTIPPNTSQISGTITLEFDVIIDGITASYTMNCSFAQDVFVPTIRGFVAIKDRSSDVDNPYKRWCIELFKLKYDITPSSGYPEFNEENFEHVAFAYTDEFGSFSFSKDITPMTLYYVKQNVVHALLDDTENYSLHLARFNTWAEIDEEMLRGDYQSPQNYVLINSAGKAPDRYGLNNSVRFENVEIPNIKITKLSTDKTSYFDYRLTPMMDAGMIPRENGPVGNNAILRTIKADETHFLFIEERYLTGATFFKPQNPSDLCLSFNTVYALEEINLSANWNTPLITGTLVKDNQHIIPFGMKKKEKIEPKAELSDFPSQPLHPYAAYFNVTITNTLKPVVVPDVPVVPVQEPTPQGPTGTVVVNFVDENGTSLSPAFSFTGEIGTNYGTSERAIDGYTLVATPENATGSFSNETTTVNYVYTNGDVVIPEVVDETPLAPAEPPVVTEPVDSNQAIEEIVAEETPLGDALPLTGHLPMGVFLGIGSIITAAGLWIKRK